MEKKLSELKKGESAKIAGFATKDSSVLKKLMAMNLFIGEPIFCISNWPSFVLRGEYNEVVCDSELAGLVLIN